VDEFLESLSERFYSKTNFHYFYDLILQELTGKSEKIIQRLKKIKLKISNDPESIEDIEWYILINYRVITNICDSNIYEPENSEVNKFTQQINMNISNSIGAGYIKQYSRDSRRDNKEHDILKVTFDCDMKRSNTHMYFIN
jgi:hypothetical protein